MEETNGAGKGKGRSSAYFHLAASVAGAKIHFPTKCRHWEGLQLLVVIFYMRNARANISIHKFHTGKKAWWWAAAHGCTSLRRPLLMMPHPGDATCSRICCLIPGKTGESLFFSLSSCFSFLFSVSSILLDITPDVLIMSVSREDSVGGESVEKWKREVES